MGTAGLDPDNDNQHAYRRMSQPLRRHLGRRQFARDWRQHVRPACWPTQGATGSAPSAPCHQSARRKRCQKLTGAFVTQGGSDSSSNPAVRRWAPVARQGTLTSCACLEQRRHSLRQCETLPPRPQARHEFHDAPTRRSMAAMPASIFIRADELAEWTDIFGGLKPRSATASSIHRTTS